MFAVVTVLLIQVLFFALCKRTYRDASLYSLVLMFMVTAQYVLLEQSVVGAPVRIIAVICLAISLAAKTARLSLMFKVPYASSVLGLWLLYVVWVAIAATANGDVEIGGYEYYGKLISKFGVASLCFVAFSILPRSRDDVVVVSLWLAGISMVNAGFVLMQAAGVQYAWSVHDALFPLSFDRSQEHAESGASFGYAPGLSSYSIATGYVLSCFGLIWIGFTRLHGSSSSGKIQSLVAIGIIGMIFSASIACLSRSSVFFFGVLAFLGVFPVLLKRGAWIPVAGLIIICMFLFDDVPKGISVRFSEGRVTGIERIYDFAMGDRLVVVSDAIKASRKSLLCGGVNKAFESGLELTAHNMFVNALLYYGIPGLCFCVAFVLSLVRCLVSIVSRATVASQDRFCLAVAYGVFAYLGKGLFHNDSFSTGGITGMLLLGVLYSFVISDGSWDRRGRSVKCRDRR